jgi:hypothetical protein
MSTPRFSIVIPTRDRADTLRHALATCLAQDFDDYEVVVCDNPAMPATQAAVAACGSARVRYVAAPRVLAMSDNWELAVSEARGEYVHVLGDDDGLLPSALRQADAVIEAQRARAVRWDAALYTWPTLALPGDADYLRLPMGGGPRGVDFREALARVVRFEACYTTLPMIYNALVHRDLLAQLRARVGRVFPGHYPDVYSGFALGAVAGHFVSLGRPLSVAGLSGHSNGVATLFLPRGTSPIDREFRDLNERGGLRRHPWVADLPVYPEVPVADSFLVAKAALFPNDPVAVDRKELARRCLDGLQAANEAAWQAGRALVRQSLRDDRALLAWFDAEQGARPFQPPRPQRLRPQQLGYYGGSLHLDARVFGVTDVAAAARLCETLLDGPGQRAGPPSPSQVVRGLVATLRACEADGSALEQIAHLNVALRRSEAEAATRLDVIHRLDAALHRSEAEGLAARQEAGALGEALRRAEAERAACQDTVLRLEAELRPFRRLPLALAVVRAGRMTLKAWRRVRRYRECPPRPGPG